MTSPCRGIEPNSAISQGELIMTLRLILVTSALLAFQVQPTFAADKTHAAYLDSVSTYKPMAGFSHVVGPTRFVGYFLQARDMCRVTVFVAAADDESRVVASQRVEIDIAAAGRSELAAGDGAALAIACTADADAIKIAPQHPAKLADAP
jgi:hypothetical protein